MRVFNHMWLVISLSLLVAACDSGFEASKLGDSSSGEVMKSPSIDELCAIAEEPPQVLSETCLQSVQAERANSYVGSFEPRYALYSDGAEKRRWVYLPSDHQIDTEDINNWVLPVGTILWKEFALESQKVETRMFEKIREGLGQEAWRASVFLWREDQQVADRTENGQAPLPEQDYALDALSQSYNVPATSTCFNCHRGSKDVGLGFSAVQLSSINPIGVSLSTLSQFNKISHAPAAQYLPDANLATEEVAGYLHGDCSHCHNPNPEAIASGLNLNLKLEFSSQSLEETALFSTAIADENLIVPGSPEASALYQRFAGQSMPPRGLTGLTQQDEEFSSLLEFWIEGL